MKKAAYLFSGRKRINKILKGKFIYLFLDYDGTLTPIARTPGKGVLAEKTKDSLRRLSKMPNCKIAVISGRALKDISKRIGLKNIIYVGNHGFEVKGPKLNFKSPIPAGYRKALEEINARLEKNLASIKGVIIEDKGVSLSVHYRLAAKKDMSALKNEFYDTLFLYEFKRNVRVRSGKMVFEVMPPIPWNKGKVALWLLGRRLFAMRNKKMRILPIYIGDDITDEDAFESLRDKGITIFVGRPRKTKAQFYLKDTKEAARFLEEILKNLKAGAL